MTTLDDDELRDMLALRVGKTNREAAAELNIPHETFRNRLKIAARRGLMGFGPVLPGYEVAKISTDSAGDVVSVTQKPEHGEVFEVPKGHEIKGISSLIDSDGNTIQQWIKTRNEARTNDIIAALQAAFENYSGRAELIEPPDSCNDALLSVYPIADQHNGLLAWGRETGESYDLKIGCERLRRCMVDLVSQSPPSKQAVILNLGDWQHTDDQTNATPRGNNLLDVDSRYFKILTTGVQLMMDCVELALSKHETVLVRNIPGNHDPHASIALTVALAAFYSSNPRVTIDTDPSDFFFHRFGSTLIGATHGHKMKPDRMAMTMATVCREEWGATKYHWFLFGHIHHETAKEIGDVRVESFQSLAGRDAFAAGRGYVAGSSLTSVTLHRDLGEIGRHRINVSPIIRQATTSAAA